MNKFKIIILVLVTLLVGTVSGIAYGEEKARRNYQGFVSPNIFVNGKALEFSNSEVPPIIMNSRTLIPIRAVAESLGVRIGFSYEDMKVTVDGQCVPTQNNK